MATVNIRALWGGALDSDSDSESDASILGELKDDAVYEEESDYEFDRLPQKSEMNPAKLNMEHDLVSIGSSSDDEFHVPTTKDYRRTRDFEMSDAVSYDSDSSYEVLAEKKSLPKMAGLRGDEFENYIGTDEYNGEEQELGMDEEEVDLIDIGRDEPEGDDKFNELGRQLQNFDKKKGDHKESIREALARASGGTYVPTLEDKVERDLAELRGLPKGERSEPKTKSEESLKLGRLVALFKGAQTRKNLASAVKLLRAKAGEGLPPITAERKALLERLAGKWKRATDKALLTNALRDMRGEAQGRQYIRAFDNEEDEGEGEDFGDEEDEELEAETRALRKELAEEDPSGEEIPELEAVKRELGSQLFTKEIEREIIRQKRRGYATKKETIRLIVMNSDAEDLASVKRQLEKADKQSVETARRLIIANAIRNGISIKYGDQRGEITSREIDAEVKHALAGLKSDNPSGKPTALIKRYLKAYEGVEFEKGTPAIHIKNYFREHIEKSLKKGQSVNLGEPSKSTYL